MIYKNEMLTRKFVEFATFLMRNKGFQERSLEVRLNYRCDARHIGIFLHNISTSYKM